MRRFKRFVTVALVLAGAAGSARAESPSNDWYVSPRLGFSAFTGIIGMEFQYKRAALAVGLPAHVGFKYYFRPHGHSWYAGPHAQHFTVEMDETIDGVKYEEWTGTQVGVGVGHRWLWRSRWNLELGVSAAYARQKWENPSQSRTEDGLLVMPGIALGFAFR